MPAHLKRGFGAILILIILVAVGVVVATGLYLVNKNSSQTSTPTATNSALEESANDKLNEGNSEWSNYTNRKVGYSIDYPETDFFVDEAHFIPREWALTGGFGGILRDFIFVDMYKSFGIPYVSDFESLYSAKTGEDPFKGKGLKIIKIKNLKIDGYDTVEYTIEEDYINPSSDRTEPTGYQHNFLIKKSDNDFILVNNVSEIEPENAKKRDSVFIQMVSTLKFLD